MHRAWWKETVVYQVYWRSFYDTNADGYGDLNGIVEKLDYIQSLGATMIWVNPFYASPDKDNGYDISDYYAIMDKAGSMADFDRLLEEVQRRGMKLMMDVVLNHTSDAHPWFRESRSSRDNPKRDWYIWRDPVNGGPPTNWRSYFNPSAWQFDPQTGQYYLHSFAIEQPDLNWRNPEVRQELYRVLRFWLDKGIDGLRLDAIALLAKPDVFADVEQPEDIRYLTNHPGLHEYLQEMHREVFRHYDILTVGEAAFVTPQTGLLYVDERRRELNTLFHFEVLDEMPEWDLPRFKRIQRKWAEALKGRGTNSQFLNNHDHTRQVTRYGNDGAYRVQSAKLLALMLHTLPGIPYIYQGEEIGMTGVRYDSIAAYQDIAMRNKYAEEVGKGRDPNEVLRSLQPLSRDSSRSPMQWNAQEHAGFTTGDPWIRVNPNYREINVEAALRDEESVFAFYQALIRLRKQHPVMIYGDYTDISGDDQHVYVYTRELRDSESGEVRWLIALNHSEQQRDFALPDELLQAGMKLLLSNYTDTAQELPQHVQKLQLRPYEACLYVVEGRLRTQ
ncbi:alpha,alpha-phosphotrehalase [Xylanibacillus composti]|uniref:Alpha-glucosidase n=1 Tax=Xylanibacillus composti TaxID=1572762 RepID=A0A8J4H941_9BACL|nr:alpha-glucosidase [Xylanibacillus composti]MDT9724022.1 alpha,alpha-phosphotrehalase [Xylanibacillus composti]GIQ71073.1 alpha-glucosidase [Xylanibacillus composti]